jgi:hypothetical protein
MRRGRKSQSGQALVLVAVALLAMIGSAALVLLAGSAEWQKNQLQTLADSTALDSALKIGPTCSGAAATTVITEADTFLATQRTRTGALAIAAGTCATPYHGTDTFGGTTADFYYPYEAHEQQVEVVLTLTLPISFGTTVGKTSTTVTRYAVAEALAAGVPAVSATTINCTGGQVNVAGDVAAQNAVSLSGGCALYAHQRLSGGAFSSLGNASVYADGQAWVSGGGTCVAGASSGSTSAICSDGYELSGHVTPACGGLTTSYLTAGNSTVNASPCAAGVGPQPVAPRSSLLSPEPNTDTNAIATLQGTGGSACTPGGVYPSIVAGGTTWGTGLAPAPVKDAAGYWHFKPSCYGYLNLASASGATISLRQASPESPTATHFLTATLPGPTTAGTLLVATISSDPSPNKTTAPVGWLDAVDISQPVEGRTEIWYYPNNPGNISTVTFATTPATINGNVQVTEWNGAAAIAPLDQVGSQAVAGLTTTTTIATGGATSQANELVITNIGFKINAGQTYTPGAGWNPLLGDVTAGFGSEYRLDLPAAVASETVTTSQTTPWANAIATFKPSGASAGGAVLDPGFYYFNGSGFAGGGGICLNGGTLLARDVTLEFVNQAGFSSGTCAAGGGANCAGSCQFGSAACSLAACPPNAGADSPNNLTWFASPCSTAPAAADAASCPGSAWCPAGDRSCWNELVWAPATNTGQIAIKGAAADAWLLGSIDWPGACTDQVNGTSSIAGTISCGTLTISAAAGAGTAVGGDAGINTAQVEARLVE